MLIKKLEKNVFLTFGTPILQKNIPNTEDVNKRLEDIILKKEKKEKGEFKSNLGGWHSTPDFLAIEDPAVQELNKWIRAAFNMTMKEILGTEKFVANCQLSGWANVNRAGDTNKVHTHPNHHWSGCYYVTAPQGCKGQHGAFMLVDPRPAAGIYQLPQKSLSQDLFFTPKPGLILLFPSWIQHSALPFKGDGTRISVAFNIRVGDIKIEEDEAA